MSKRWAVSIACVAALSAVAVGCGGDDEGEEVVEITKTELIQRGDAICKQGEEKFERQADAYGEENDVDPENPEPEQIEEIGTEYFVPSLRTQAEEIRELGAPEGDEEEVEAILIALESGIDEIEAEPGVLLESENPLEEAGELASAYGFEECGA